MSYQILVKPSTSWVFTRSGMPRNCKGSCFLLWSLPEVIKWGLRWDVNITESNKAQVVPLLNWSQPPLKGHRPCVGMREWEKELKLCAMLRWKYHELPSKPKLRTASKFRQWQHENDFLALLKSHYHWYHSQTVCRYWKDYSKRNCSSTLINQGNLHYFFS